MSEPTRRHSRLWIHRRDGEAVMIGESRVTVLLKQKVTRDGDRVTVADLLIEGPADVPVRRLDWEG